MKRFLSILLALALALTLGIPALAAEHQAGDTVHPHPGQQRRADGGRPHHLRSVPADGRRRGVPGRPV